MSKILIFGNSGSGKSTLASEISETDGLAHLDLDTLAWEPGSPPQRRSLDRSAREIDEFLEANQDWVVEGCYTDLLELVVFKSTQVIFLNLPVESCIANARNRPWEPHKYASKVAQDANLPMLIEWIAQYAERDDTFSYAAHSALYEDFTGEKKLYVRNERNREGGSVGK